MLKRCDFAFYFQAEIVFLIQLRNHAARKRAEVDIGSVFYPGSGDFFRSVTTFHHQRHPAFQYFWVFAVFHLFEEVVGTQLGVTLTQIVDVLFTPDKAHVRCRVDELIGGRECAVFYQRAPQLQRNLEIGIDGECTVDLNITVGVFRGVVQFAVTGVAGAGVVPAIGAFVSNVAKTLDQGNLKRRVQAVQQGSQSGAHDTTTN